MEQESSDSAVLRRRRRIARAAKEKTPDPTVTVRQKHSDEFSESSTYESVQIVKMQLRPPGAKSAHESKILRRRDKTFASAAARSHSQPRQAERLSSPEASELLRSVAKRSLSSPRHKEESSEGEPFATTPEILERYPVFPSKEDDNLSRLEQNLRRFEDERRRFELEKKVFEREKREHKVRYKQYLDSEDRRRLLDNYRKNSDRIALPADPEDRRRMVQSLRLSRKEAPIRLKPVKPSGYESSTQLSSSESEVVQYEEHRNHRSPPPVPKLEPAKLPPPPPTPIRRSASRNNSLSPIRPARRSKTPDTGSARNSSIEDTAASEKVQRKTSLRKSSIEGEVIQNSEPKSSLFHKPSFGETPTSERKRSLRLYDDQQIQNLERKGSLTASEVKLVRKRSLQAAIQPRDDTAGEVQPGGAKKKPKGPTVISKIIAYFKRPKAPVDERVPPAERLLTIAFIKEMFTDLRSEWSKLKADYPAELDAMRKSRNKCLTHMIMLVLLCGFGGLMFRYTEGSFENIYKCEVRKVKRDFIDYLWTVSHNMREDDWKSAARTRLRKFEEELHVMQELGVRRFPGMKSWNFVNCVLYCWTVITTIGYGHITPQTALGRSLTVVYALIGIPMFLILLADFGKLFTRMIKFVWAYVRRLYYTGTCRKVRKQPQVLGVISGINQVYDYAIHRPSQYIYGDKAVHNHTPPRAPSTTGAFQIDDEFNLPISLAVVILILYIIIGAFIFAIREDWSYTEAFYFVFISMSTIGFGDVVPNHPIFMMCSIAYMIFGLALTSMFINVVQIKLSDTFKKGSAKISATIGLTTGDYQQPKLDAIREDPREDHHEAGHSAARPHPILPKRTI